MNFAGSATERIIPKPHSGNIREMLVCAMCARIYAGHGTKGKSLACFLRVACGRRGACRACAGGGGCMADAACRGDTGRASGLWTVAAAMAVRRSVPDRRFGLLACVRRDRTRFQDVAMDAWRETAGYGGARGVRVQVRSFASNRDRPCARSRDRRAQQGDASWRAFGDAAGGEEGIC